MEQYTVLVAFATDNLMLADDIRADCYQALTDIVEDCGNQVEFLQVQMVRGNRVTEDDIQESLALADEADSVANAGFNPNPLPEGMPEL